MAGSGDTIRNDSKVKLNIRRTICYIVLIISVFLALFPFVMLIVNSTRANSEIQRAFTLIPGKSFFINMKNLINDKNISVLSGIRNSLIVSVGVCVLSVYFSALTAYGIFAYDFKFKKFAYTFILLIMMVPTQVSALGFVRFMDDLKLTNTFIPLIVPTVAAPAVFFFMKQYMESSLPMEIVEAGRIDGGHEFYIFNAIVMPIMKPAMAVQAIFQFVMAWNNYFLPALILEDKAKKTLPIWVAILRNADFQSFDMGKVYAMLFITIMPLIVVYLFLSKYIIRGIALGSVKG